MIQFNLMNMHAHRRMVAWKNDVFTLSTYYKLGQFRTKEGRAMNICCGNCCSPSGLQIAMDFSDGVVRGIIRNKKRNIGMVIFPSYTMVNCDEEYVCKCGHPIIRNSDFMRFMLAKNTFFGC